MLDLTWERSRLLYDIKIDEINQIFKKYDKNIDVYEFHAIKLGCRNSNFVILTNKGKYLLRAVSSGELNNEAAAYKIIKGLINVPDLYYYTAQNEYLFFIYEYIEGTSLQKIIIKNNSCDNSYIEQAAESAALLHSIDLKTLDGIEELNVPPFHVWYDHFLSGAKVKERLGDDLYQRTALLVSDMKGIMDEIDRYQAFIHSDFRPANMMLDTSGRLYIVDWEYALTGHALADIGQFFRYRFLFSKTNLSRFESIYNQAAKQALPSNWEQLSAFRDLVNPLQMLSYDLEMPNKYADLINLISIVLDYFKY